MHRLPSNFSKAVVFCIDIAAPPGCRSFSRAMQLQTPSIFPSERWVAQASCFGVCRTLAAHMAKDGIYPLTAKSNYTG